MLLNVTREYDAVKIVVEDDGIGRVTSTQNKPINSLAHQSKGVSLTQSRLDLDNLLKHRYANMEIVDKNGENEKGTGTCAIVILSEEA